MTICGYEPICVYDIGDRWWMNEPGGHPRAEGRPARRYFRLTAVGEMQARAVLRARGVDAGGVS